MQAQYGADAMQALQKEWGAKDIVWLTINSTNQNHSEYKSAAQMNAWMKDRGAAQKAVLLDSTSATGRAYSAKTTPHMFVIDPTGKDPLQRRDRRQAQRARVRPQDREQLRARRVERSGGGETGHRCEHDALRLQHQVLNVMRAPESSGGPSLSV